MNHLPTPPSVGGRVWKGLLVTAFLLLLPAAALWFLDRTDDEIQTEVSIASAFTGDTTGYQRALRPVDMAFPRDHGAHPGFKTEWWYFTGNLSDAADHRYGYQFTVFRYALAPPGRVANDGSGWATDQLYFAHLAVTDARGDRFAYFERYSRGAAGLAGAEVPFRVWVEDWEARREGGEGLALRLTAAQEGYGIDLALSAQKPVVLQGDRGYSIKGDLEGQASYYYSVTRFATTGTLIVGGRPVDVAGLSWMDREWSTSMLDASQEGWDWFSLQLSNGMDLMYFQIRQKDGGDQARRYGAIFSEQGAKTGMDAADVTLDVLRLWTSPHSKTSYPAGWTLRSEKHDLALTIMPILADQELSVSVRYWEGAVDVDGVVGGTDVTGAGYVELTGYGDAVFAR